MSETTAEARAHLDRLWARGRDFLGTEVAILAGAMSWVSERHLVSAISNAGPMPCPVTSPIAMPTR